MLFTATTIGSFAFTYRNLVESFQDAPKDIRHLTQEHESVHALVKRLTKMVEDPDSEAHLDNDVKYRVCTEVNRTSNTLRELYDTIQRLMPAKSGPSRRSIILIRAGYLWHQKTIQANLVRLRDRKDALSLILHLWSR
jgi:protein subunit release factor A